MMAEAALAQISQGSLNAIFNDPDRLQKEFPVPICQCVQIKALGSQGDDTPKRYRIVLSDVKNFVQAILATQANHVIHEGKLKMGSIVRLKQYQANSVKGKRILIVLDLDVIESLGEHATFGEPEKFGEPDKFRDPGNFVGKEEDGVKPVNTTIGGPGFYGNKPHQPPQERALPSRAGPSSSASHANIYPIEGLSPYAHKWTIKARVTQKSEMKTWNKQSGQGKLFSVNLLDESGEIRGTAFNDQADTLYEKFQEGSVYYISNPCKVQLAKKQFSNLPNDYELVFERETVVEKAMDQDNVPQVRYNFTTISDLQSVEKDGQVDIIAVLKEVGDVEQIVSKTTQKPYDKRELTLVDESGYSVRLTIWGKSAVSFDANPESIIAAKGVKVSEFNGRSLSLLSSGSMTIDPDIPEAHKLKGWYDSQGRTENFASHSNMGSAGAAGGRQDPLKTIAQIQEEQIGMSEEATYYSVKATIVYIKQDTFSYPACSNEGCNKKVVESGDGTWRCEKCEANHSKPNHRYIMSLSVNDHTGQLWLSGFDDTGRGVMGMSADQLMELKENDTTAMENAFEEANMKTWIFKCRAKMDTFQDQAKVRHQIMSASPIHYAMEANKLASLIKQYSLE